jgi:hypothetical protein
VLFDERDAQAGAGEQNGGEAAGGAGADDQDVEHGSSVGGPYGGFAQRLGKCET